MADPVKREVEITFNGVARRVKTPLALVFDIEAATGVGLIELVALVASKRARLDQIAATLRAALNGSGAKYEMPAVIAAIERDGIFKAYASASVILQSFFEVPENAKSKKVKAPEKAPE